MRILKPGNKWKRIWWIVGILLVVGIKLFSLNGAAVEKYYTYGLYPVFSAVSGFLLGWISFSVGDILYFVAALWILYKVVKNIRLMIHRGVQFRQIALKFLDTLLLVVYAYILFNLVWGLNYNRSGLVAQLKLHDLRYDSADLVSINEVLVQKVNAYKHSLTAQNAEYPDSKTLFKRAEKTFQEAEKKYPFLAYSSRTASVKPSLFGWLGNYLGFTGYYNPFTGEAQVNTTVPQFLRPYIANHEIAHQIGYAKEDAASFAGYLAILYSNDTLFKYSAYLDLYSYANNELAYLDSTSSRAFEAQLHPDVQADIREWREFSQKHKSLAGPVITWLYGKFLTLNEQPSGMRSYNRVILLLTAYYKKYGLL